MCAEIYEEGNNTQYKLYGSDSSYLPMPYSHTALPGCAHLRRNVAVLAFRYALRHAEMKTKCVLPAVAGAWLARAEISPISCPRTLCLFSAVEQEVEKEMKQSVEMRAVRC